MMYRSGQYHSDKDDHILNADRASPEALLWPVCGVLRAQTVAWRGVKDTDIMEMHYKTRE